MTRDWLKRRPDRKAREYHAETTAEWTATDREPTTGKEGQRHRNFNDLQHPEPESELDKVAPAVTRYCFPYARLIPDNSYDASDSRTIIRMLGDSALKVRAGLSEETGAENLLFQYLYRAVED